MRVAFREGSDPADVLHLIDTNGDGLISVDEFLKGVNSIISLALPIR